MAPKLKPVEQQTIVITGASSGIGLATAQAACKRGAKVVLVARNGDALARIERELVAAGGQATHVIADVGERSSAERVAAAAVERFGGFDTWVNNAGVGIFGRLEDVSDEDSRRLFDTNFWGLVYGSLAAVKHLKGKGGAVVNLGSVASDVAFSPQGMYCASKHAIRGFTDALRQELIEENAPVAVSLIKPASIDTPYPRNARNYMPYEPKLPPPVYRPEEVAGAILHAAEHGPRDIYVGGGGRMMSAMGRHLPEAMDWLAGKVMSKQQTRGEPARHPAGLLQRPSGDEGQVRGDHPGVVMPVSLYTRAVKHPYLTLGLAAAAGVAVAGLLGAADGHRA
jgi:NAD(P)-dependent dehydrogenase (short-subunit alcohol dehydrogenase family)